MFRVKEKEQLRRMHEHHEEEISHRMVCVCVCVCVCMRVHVQLLPVLYYTPDRLPLLCYSAGSYRGTGAADSVAQGQDWPSPGED